VVQDPPGRWDVMISYTKRNAVSESFAYAIQGELDKRGFSVWLMTVNAFIDRGLLVRYTSRLVHLVSLRHRRSPTLALLLGALACT
jgi:hypothetical protein